MKLSKVQSFLNYLPFFDLLDGSSLSPIKFFSFVVILPQNAR
tara:strand:+ start:85 stop:210 length:126 start_codon:yes stop_codon:yes gene_type:complete